MFNKRSVLTKCGHEHITRTHSRSAEEEEEEEEGERQIDKERHGETETQKERDRNRQAESETETETEMEMSHSTSLQVIRFVLHYTNPSIYAAEYALFFFFPPSVLYVRLSHCQHPM